MSEKEEITVAAKLNGGAPILQLNRLTHVKIGGRVLDTTGTKLEKYIAYATEGLKTEITSGDVIEYGLKLLFDRDAGFKEWLKQN